jgi:AcrR family transcriptional regulator
VERERAATFDAIGAAVEQAPPRRRLRVFVERYFEIIGANRHSWWLLYGEAGAAAVNEMRQRNADVIERALVAALGPREGMDVLTQAIVGAGEQVGRWWAEHPEVDETAVVDRFVAFAGAAIAALPPAAPR